MNFLRLENKILNLIIGGLLILALYLCSLYNYLLFHSLTELFSIVIAYSIFILAWNCQNYIDNNYLIFLGIAYLFIGFIDTLHTLAYYGMGVFQGYGPNLPTQLWIIARYMESISLLLAYYFFEKKKINTNFILFSYVIITVLLLLFIYYWKVFPVCYLEGIGLTPFKKISEYIISLILIASLFFLRKKKEKFDPKVLNWIILSIFLTIISEIAFTFYISVYGLSNLVGHIFKIISFYFIYKALVITGLTEPHRILYKSLKESEEKLSYTMAATKDGIWDINLESGELDVSDNYYRILGYNPGEIKITQKKFEELLHPDDKDRVLQKIEDCLEDKIEDYQEEFRLRTKSGKWKWVLGRGKVVSRNSKGKALRFIGTHVDISQRKEMEQRLEKMARIDSLTGCYNRGYGLELLEWQRKISSRSKIPFMIAFLDVDRF
ncbi:MAG: MASE3 domain-containing protein [Candidatus Caldatribacteriota bacterium]